MDCLKLKCQEGVTANTAQNRIVLVKSNVSMTTSVVKLFPAQDPASVRMVEYIECDSTGTTMKDQNGTTITGYDSVRSHRIITDVPLSCRCTAVVQIL